MDPHITREWHESTPPEVARGWQRMHAQDRRWHGCTVYSELYIYDAQLSALMHSARRWHGSTWPEDGSP